MSYSLANMIQRQILWPYFVMAWNEKIFDANNRLFKQFLETYK